MFPSKLFAGLAIAFSLTPAMSAIVTYQGGDVANSSDPRPNATASAAAFNTAAATLGTVNLITFESAAVGTFSSLLVAPGVTLSGTDYQGNSHGQSILNAPTSTPDGLYGYNTTAGGSHFAYINGGFLTFSFANAINAFGAFLTGVQLSGETLNFTDGSSESIAIRNNGSGVQFVGFTDAGKSISSITVNTTSAANPLGDFVGVDDVRYVNSGSVAAVPEPSTYALMIAGLGALGYAARRRRA